MYLITEDKSRTKDNSNYAIVDSLWTFQYCVYFAVDTKSCVLSNAFTREDGLYQQKHHSNLYEDYMNEVHINLSLCLDHVSCGWLPGSDVCACAIII